MPTSPGLLDSITYALLEAGQASEDLEDRVVLWKELLQLLEPEPLLPPPSRGLREVPFVASSPEGADRIPTLLRQLGLKPGRPFRRAGRQVVPVYTARTEWLHKLLSMAGRAGSSSGPSEPERLWGELKASVVEVRRAEDAYELVIASRESAVLLCRCLRQLGLSLGKPFPSGEQVILPIYGGSPWWGRLLGLRVPDPLPPPEAGDPDPCKLVTKVLREAGLPAEHLEEMAYIWLQIRPAITAYPRARQGATGWEGRLVVSGSRAEQLSALLLQLGVEHPPPALQRDGEAVISIGGCPWLGRLLEPGAPVAGARLQNRRWPFDAACVLQIVATDRTFELSSWRGRSVWAGRCLQCEQLLLVGLDGQPISAAHLVQLDVEEHGLLCLRCATRFRSLQRSQDPRSSEIWEQLRALRRDRGG